MEEKKRLCPACGVEMELKLENFSIGADGHGGLMSLFMEQYDVDLYACPRCGKVELYTADFKQEAPQSEEAEASEEAERPEPGREGLFGFGG